DRMDGEMGLRKRLLLIGVGLTMAATALTGIVAWITSRQVTAIAVTGSRELADSDLGHVAGHISSMCESAAALLARAASTDLQVARGTLQRAGGLRLSPQETVSWKAVNQFTKNGSALVLPKALIAGAWLGQVTDASQKVAVVDEAR